jgi:hypothetical protein
MNKMVKQAISVAENDSKAYQSVKDELVSIKSKRESVPEEVRGSIDGGNEVGEMKGEIEELNNKLADTMKICNTAQSDLSKLQDESIENLLVQKRQKALIEDLESQLADLRANKDEPILSNFGKMKGSM